MRKQGQEVKAYSKVFCEIIPKDKLIDVCKRLSNVCYELSEVAIRTKLTDKFLEQGAFFDKFTEVLNNETNGLKRM